MSELAIGIGFAGFFVGLGMFKAGIEIREGLEYLASIIRRDDEQ